MWRPERVDLSAFAGPTSTTAKFRFRTLSDASANFDGFRIDSVRIVTFNQHRSDLVPTQTLHEALCPVGDTVDYRGKPVHITGWVASGAGIGYPHRMDSREALVALNLIEHVGR